MNQAKPVTWFEDNPKPNTFFFRSPFHSWKFIINTVLITLICAGVFVSFLKYWGELRGHFYTFVFPILFLVPQGVIYPYWWALKRHARIKELYLSGQIPEQAAGSPIDQLLEVADNSMNEGLRNSMTTFGFFLLVLVLSKFGHLR